MNKQINSLQGLRIFLFIIIFFFHADIFIEKDTLGSAIVNGGGGMLAVSVFFVLSGFVTGLKKKKCKIIRNITQKTKKFYPLHILFLIMMAVLPYNLLSIIHTTQGKISLILNSLLLQSWIPKAEIWRGFNGPSWYLSTLVFMFAITPLLEILDDKITQDNKKKVGRYCIIILLAIVISFVLPAIINQNVEYWLYAFPPSRVLDYGSGFFAARLLLEKKGQVFKSQVLTFTCEVFCVLYFSSILAVFQIIGEGFQRAAIFLPVSIFFVCILATEKGVVSKFLSNKILVRLGNNSMFYYLCHRTVLSYIYFGFKLLGIDATKKGLNWLIVFGCLGIIIVLGELYKVFIDRRQINGNF